MSDFESREHQQSLRLQQSKDREHQQSKEREHQQSLRLQQSKDAFVLEGQRTYIAINGGGAIALLAFIQAIWDKPGAGPLRWAALIAIFIFAIGVGVGAASYAVRHYAHRKYHFTDEYRSFRWAYIYMPTIAVGLFFIATLVTVVGGALALWSRPVSIQGISLARQIDGKFTADRQTGS